MIGLQRAALLLATMALASAPAFAQSADPPASRVEVGVGALWVGQEALGTKPITETIASGSSTPVFTTSSELAAAGGVSVHAGVRITRTLSVEANASYEKPQLRIAISGDTEGAAAVTATESVHQYLIGGDVLWRLPLRRRPRIEPFVLAGAGYLRQLHEAATLVETGHYFDAGGGVSWLLTTGRKFHSKGTGLRFDARALVRSKGIAFDGGSKVSPAVGVSLFVRF